MSLPVAAAVLFAALLHAGWNALAKAIPHRLVASTLIGATYLVIGAVAVFFAPAPASSSIAFIAASSIVQTVYLILLTASYSHGDFGQVYPLARGLSVLLVTLFSTFVLAEYLDLWQSVGVALVIVSLMSLVFVRRSGRPSLGDGNSSSRRGILLALLTGVTIAAYSLIDGVGVRVSGSSIGYAAWLFVLQGAMLVCTCYAMERDRKTFRSEMRRYLLRGLVGGAMSLVAYAIVLWGQSIAPLSLVSALRETSVLLAGIIGFLFFGERLSVARIAITVLAAIGIIIMQVG